MSDKIQITEVTQLDAHIVPCQIHYTGDANTSDYFTPSKVQQDNQHISYFRGCKFMGTKIDISKYDGYLINKSESLAASDDGDYKVVNTYNTIGKFNDLIVYGHDRLPSLTSKYVLMKEWQAISEAIHQE